jgi:hypothetical protein
MNRVRQMVRKLREATRIDALATLRSMSYTELMQLPAHKTIELTGFGRRVTLTTYMDLLKSHNSDLQIAVQMFAHGRLGFSRVCARGFRVTIQGTYRPTAVLRRRNSMNTRDRVGKR